MSMTVSIPLPPRRAVAIALAILGLAAAPALAEETPREVKGDFSAVRLLNGGQTDGAWQAGIHITLQPGWKTYWRVPGESGVPPQFDWSGSDNAGDIAVAMPVPIRFSDGNGDGIGYKTEVVFPVSVKPADPALPVQLALKLFYAVCNDICVPVMADLKLELSAATASASDRFRLGVATNDLPSDDAGQTVAVRVIRLAETSGGKPVIEVTIAGLSEPVKADIFAETEATAYFRKPELVSSEAGEATFRLPVDGVDAPETLKGTILRLTISGVGTNIVHEGLVQ